jgi:hypothetical protein
VFLLNCGLYFWWVPSVVREGDVYPVFSSFFLRAARRRSHTREEREEQRRRPPSPRRRARDAAPRPVSFGCRSQTGELAARTPARRAGLTATSPAGRAPAAIPSDESRTPCPRWRAPTSVPWRARSGRHATTGELQPPRAPPAGHDERHGSPWAALLGAVRAVSGTREFEQGRSAKTNQASIQT